MADHRSHWPDARLHKRCASRARSWLRLGGLDEVVCRESGEERAKFTNEAQRRVGAPRLDTRDGALRDANALGDGLDGQSGSGTADAKRVFHSQMVAHYATLRQAQLASRTND